MIAQSSRNIKKTFVGGTEGLLTRYYTDCAIIQSRESPENRLPGSGTGAVDERTAGVKPHGLEMGARTFRPLKQRLSHLQSTPAADDAVGRQGRVILRRVAKITDTHDVQSGAKKTRKRMRG